MDGSIRLSARERKTLLQAYRGASIARRALQGVARVDLKGCTRSPRRRSNRKSVYCGSFASMNATVLSMYSFGM